MTAKLPRRSRKKSTAIDPTRIGKFLRLLASDRPGEVVAAAAALKPRWRLAVGIFTTWPLSSRPACGRCHHLSAK